MFAYHFKTNNTAGVFDYYYWNRIPADDGLMDYMKDNVIEEIIRLLPKLDNV